MAQAASLGASVAILLGWGGAVPVAELPDVAGFHANEALLFVVFRSKREKVSIEGLIGITYSGSIALSPIVLEHAATGTEEITEVLTGSLLTVSPKEVAFIAVLYSVVGFIHWLARKKLLLVFAFLLIPVVAAMTSVEGTSRRIVYGWLFGILGCFGGLELSLRLDCPTGPAMVAFFLVQLIAVWLVRTLAGKLRECPPPQKKPLINMVNVVAFMFIIWPNSTMRKLATGLAFGIMFLTVCLVAGHVFSHAFSSRPQDILKCDICRMLASTSAPGLAVDLPKPVLCAVQPPIVAVPAPTRAVIAAKTVRAPPTV